MAVEAVPPRVAFYAPMKSPEHATPSGDRRIARLTLQVLRLSGFDPFIASGLRTLEMQGDPDAQAGLIRDAEVERARLVSELRDDPPSLWLTYHCYYKAPDLIGPSVAGELGVPYVISEPSISVSRRSGPWSDFAVRSERAIAQADRLFWTTARDRPALEAEGHAGKMTHLPAFLDPGPAPEGQSRRAGDTLQLLTIAMMRPGDKVESYRRLAAALLRLDTPWHLTVVGDGTEEGTVRAMFQQFGSNVTLAGRIDDRDELAAEMSVADVFVWPGVGEGVGMVYLEAQAAGLPVVAEDHPSARELVAEPCPASEDPGAFAEAIRRLADPDRWGMASAKARRHVVDRHSIKAASECLRRVLGPLCR